MLSDELCMMTISPVAHHTRSPFVLLFVPRDPSTRRLHKRRLRTFDFDGIWGILSRRQQLMTMTAKVLGRTATNLFHNGVGFSWLCQNHVCVYIYVDINIHIHISYILHPFWDTHKFSPSWWSWTLGCDPPPPSAAAPPAAAAVPPPVTITPPGPPTTWLPPDTTSVPAFPLARQLQTSHCRVPHLWKISRNCWGMCWRHCEARSLSRASDQILGGSQENPFKKTYWSMSRQDRTAEGPDWFLCQRQKAWVLEPEATTKNTQCVVSRTALSCLVMWWDSNIHQTKGPSNFWSYLQGHCAELASDVCPFSVAHEPAGQWHFGTLHTSWFQAFALAGSLPQTFASFSAIMAMAYHDQSYKIILLPSRYWQDDG